MSRREEAARLAAVAGHPATFRQALLIDADGGPRYFGPSLDPWQQTDFAALDSAWQSIAGHDVTPQFRRAWLERPRGHSKTHDIAAMVAWVLFASRRRLSGVVAAADADQAALLRDAIARLLTLNPSWLPKFIKVQRDRVLGLRDEKEFCELRIIAADAPSSYGLTPDFCVCDETSIWPKRDLWDSLFSAAAKRANCLLVSICNAGFEQSWQWPLREAVREDPAWYFHSLDGPQASWMTAERLAEQRRLLPDIAYRRLWLNQWSSGSGDAISERDIDAACVLPSPPAGPEKGWIYVAGVDLGIKRDASAVVVIGRHVGYREAVQVEEQPIPQAVRTMREIGVFDDLDDALPLPKTPETRYRFIGGTGRTRLAALKVFLPGAHGGTIDLASVERAILELHSNFRLEAVGCDPWEARYLAERLRQVRVPVELVDTGGTNQKSRAEATLSAFSERLIEMWPDSTLLADLRNLRVVEKSYGVRLESPRKSGGEGTRHGDTASALSIALHLARRYANAPPAIAYGGAPLLACYAALDG